MWKRIAEALCAIGRFANHIEGENGVEVSQHGDSIRISGTQQAAAASTWDVHGYRTLAGGTILIRRRTVRLHTIDNVTVAEQTVGLSGNPAWVFARIDRTTAALVAVLVESTEPESNSVHLNVPLYRFDLNTGTGRYSLADSGKFDVNIDAPVRGT